MVNEMRKRGFSIVEVMFAIMILGVGFIMVAAIFPVAIQQNQANIEESTGRTVALSGAIQTANIIRLVPLADRAAFNTAGEFRRVAEIPNTTPIFARDFINSSTIYDADPRFGWTSLYQYTYAGAASKAYKLIAVALRARNFSEQDNLSLSIGYSGYPGTIFQTPADGYDNAAVRCTVTFSADAGTPGDRKSVV